MASGEKRRAIQQRRPRPKASELLDERAMVNVWEMLRFDSHDAKQQLGIEKEERKFSIQSSSVQLHQEEGMGILWWLREESWKMAGWRSLMYKAVSKKSRCPDGNKKARFHLLPATSPAAAPRDRGPSIFVTS